MKRRWLGPWDERTYLRIVFVLLRRLAARELLSWGRTIPNRLGFRTLELVVIDTCR